MKHLLLQFLSGIVILMIAEYVTADIADDLVVYFTFDNIDGGRILDESGNSLDAEIIKDTQFVEGKYGNAVHITRETEDCINIPAANELEISEAITMMAWVYHEGWIGSTSQWLDKGAHSDETKNGYGMVVFDKKDVPGLNVFENGSGIGVILGGQFRHRIITQNPMEDKTWHHIVGTCEGRSVRIYLDGERLVGHENQFDFIGVNDEDLRIGCVKGKPEYAFKDGFIDEVAIWSRALSEDEIKTAMRGPLFPISPKDKVATTWGQLKRL